MTMLEIAWGRRKDGVERGGTRVEMCVVDGMEGEKEGREKGGKKERGGRWEDKIGRIE
jgi:hypothetical protein